MVEIKNLDAKQYFTVLIAIIVLADLVILLNIPLLRQILGFLCFTTVPGLLILHILKFNKIEFLKKFVLSVGLSVAFLMFAGLLVNSFYPLILKPLSLDPILISFNVILLILIFIAYKRNRNDFDVKDVFNFKLDLKGKLASPLIFPIIFPFMSVFGTYLMNTQGNNIILLAMLFLIPAYVVAVVYLRERIPDATYPVAVWMIGMSLLLMHGLTSYHLMGRDVHTEFYCFRLALSNFHWDISKYYNSCNACLSVTILPMVYHTLSNINGEYIFKLFFGLIGSITPLGIYIISKKYIGKRYAFFASLLLIFQLAFIYSMQSSTKQEIATLFFVLAILVLFDVEVDKLSKKILFLIFMFSVVVSHYATAYIFFILMAMILLTLSSRSFFTTEKASKFITAGITVLFFSVIFFWYSQVTQAPFNSGVNFFEQTFRNLGNFFVEDLRNPAQLNVVGIGLETATIPNKISVYVHDAIFVTIGIGVITLLWKYRSYKEKIDAEYFVGILICAGLLALFVALPFVSQGYGGQRFFLQVLVFLAPVFAVGGNTMAKIIRRPKTDVMILLILLISLFSCVTYLQYHFYGIPYSPDYEHEGLNRDEYYIYDQELVAATWLKEHGTTDLKVYKDFYAGTRLSLAYGLHNPFRCAMFKNESVNGYVYLTRVNTVNEEVYSSYGIKTNITEYSELFEKKGKIYNNGGSKTYK